jgi:hypothetical protein
MKIAAPPLAPAVARTWAPAPRTPHGLRPRRLVLACLLALGIELASIRPSFALTGTPGNPGNLVLFGQGSNPGTNDGGDGGFNATGVSGSPVPIGGSGGGFAIGGGGGGPNPGAGSGANGAGFGLAGWLVGGGGGTGGGFSSQGLGGGGGGGGSVNASCTPFEFCPPQFIASRTAGLGGGGGGGLGLAVSGSYSNTGAITGGKGGNGGPAVNGASCGFLASGSRSGGGAGGGGAGVLLSAAAVLTSSGTISGGAGGYGSNGCAVVSGPATNAGAGGGGGGGAGVLMGAGSSLSNTGSISGGSGIGGGGGGAGVLMSAGSSLSNTGSISGGYGVGGNRGVGVLATGNASIVNAGAIAGRRAITLTSGGNRLELHGGYAFTGNVISDGSGAGDTLVFGGAGTANVFLPQIGPNIFSRFQGFARFEKTGSGTWTASNVAAQAMILSVSAGTLELANGVLPTGSSVGVMSGGTLAGIGSVGGSLTVNSGGTLAPGRSATPLGTLTLNTGPFVQSAGSTLSIAADGAGNSSKVVLLSGSATLSGNVSVAFSAAPALGQTYTIVSGGSVVGAFALVTATGLAAGHAPWASYGASSATLNIGQIPAITSANAATFTAGAAASFPVGVTGFPAPTCSATGVLPLGITFSTSTCTLSGTTLASGIHPLTFNASSVAGNATQSFTLTVVQSPSITSANATNFTIGAAGSFPLGMAGFPAPACSVTGALPAGVSFNTATCTLSGTPLAAGSYPLTFTASNGVGTNATQSFTLSVSQSPAITSANAAGFTTGTAGSFTLTMGGFPAPTCSVTGTLPGGVTFNTSTCTLSGTPVAGGIYPLTFTASNGVGPNATQSFTLTVGQAPSITSANAATFTAGTAASFALGITGFPVPACSAVGALPGGITFNTSTCTLSGTPTAATGGTYPITFSVSNGVGTNATQSFMLTVLQAPAITSASAATFPAGGTGSFPLTMTGYPAPSCSVTGTLPSGISFNTATCTLSGSSLAAGTYPISFTASNGVGTNATQSFTLTVGAATSHTGQTATGTGTATATFTGGGTNCSFTSSQFVGLGTVAPPGSYTFPHGLFNFTTQNCTVGGAVTVTVTYPQALPPDAVFLKYGRTSANATPHWYSHPATISGNTATYTVTDGGPGDDDLAANGSITDPAGLGVVAGGIVPEQVPTLDRWALLLLGALMWVVGIVRRKRT